MKIELSPIGLYRVEFRPYGGNTWERLGVRMTWNQAFKLYRFRETAVNEDGIRLYVLHRIVPVYETRTL